MKITQRLISFVLTLSLFSSISVGAWAETLTLPASLKVIGEEAFAHDSSLDEVVIPEGVESIETRAFAESSVRKVKLPRSLSYIADDAFWPNSPTVDVDEGSYAYRWTAGHELVTGLAFNDSTAYDHHDVRAAFSDNERIGLYHIEWVRNYEIANYDALMEKYGGRPTWSAAFTGESYGATLRCVEWNGQDPQHIDLLIDHEPEFPCTLHYEIICSWGGESITGLGTIEYRNVKLPTGMELPNEFRGLRVGETFTFHPQILPANYSFGDFILSEFWTDVECDCWNEWENGDNVCYIRPREAGIISGTFVKRYENVQMRKNVVLYVEDENGNVPAPHAKLAEEYHFDMAVALQNEQGFQVYTDNRTLGISFSNLHMLRELYGDSCTWSFETIGGAPLDLSWKDEGNYFEFSINNFGRMTENTESTVRATLHWGETSASTIFRFRFGRFTLPEEIRFEQDIRMTVGETYRATVSVLPESWGEKYFLYYDIGGNAQMEKWNDEREAYYLRAEQSGYYVARPHIHAWDNVFIYGDVFFIPVYEKDGSIEDVKPFFVRPQEWFEYDYMLGQLPEPNEEGWFSDRVIFGWILDNAEQLYMVYGDDPEIVWGYERTGGMDFQLELNPWKADYVVGDACSITLREMPTEPGVMEFILFCEWNGHRGEMPCRVYVNEKPARLPQTNTFPDEITVAVGETVYVSGHYPEGSYDVGENYYWINADDAYVQIERNSDEKGSLAITGIQEGTIQALAKVGVSGNAYVQKPVTVTVTQSAQARAEAVTNDIYFISWNEVEGVDSYGISVYTDPECTKMTRFFQAQGNSAQLELDVGTQYWFVVEYFLNSQHRSFAAVTAKPMDVLPSPSNLNAVVQDDGSVSLSWDAVKDADGYRIYYSDNAVWTRDTQSIFCRDITNSELTLEVGEAKTIWVSADQGNGPNARSQVFVARYTRENLLKETDSKELNFDELYIDPADAYIPTEGITDPVELAFANRFNRENGDILQLIRDYNNDVTSMKDYYANLQEMVGAKQFREENDSIVIESDGSSFTIHGDRVYDLTEEYVFVESTQLNNGTQFIYQNDRSQTIFVAIYDREMVISSQPVDVSFQVRDAASYDSPVSYEPVRYNTNILEDIGGSLLPLASVLQFCNDRLRSNFASELERGYAYFQQAYGFTTAEAGEFTAIRWLQNKIKSLDEILPRLNRLGQIAGVTDMAVNGTGIYQAQQFQTLVNEIRQHGHPSNFEAKFQEHRYHAEQLNRELQDAETQCGWIIFLKSSSLAIDLAGIAFPQYTAVTASFGIVFSRIAQAMDNYLENLAETIDKRDKVLHYAVSGTVRDKDTAEPIENVQVSVETSGHDPILVHSDSGGNYFFEPLSDVVRIKFTKKGYIDLEISLPEKEKLIVTDVTYPYVALMEQSNGTIWGKVSDPSGRGIQSVKVVLGDYSTLTDAEGKYILRPLPGDYEMVFSKVGYVKSKPIHFSVSERQNTEVNMTLKVSNIIRTRAELESIQSDGDYYLGNSIDLSDAPWTPLPWFSGTLDGCGFGIRGMTIIQSFDGNLGLFGGLNGGRLTDLIVSGTIDVPADQSFTNVGFLCGNSLNASIDNCMSYGSINIRDGNGMVFAGGILGLGKAELSECLSSADINVKTRNNTNISGLVGKLDEGTISGSVYHGTLSLEQTGSNSSAYFTAVGTAYADNAVFNDCVVSGTIEVTTNNAFAHACGLARTVSGINEANVTATAKNASAMASGCELGSRVTNSGTITAVCQGSGSAYAVGITGSNNRAVECRNTGAVSAHCSVGDSLAVGVSDCADSENEGSVSSVCGKGKAIGQGMTNCSRSHNSGNVQVSNLGTNGAEGELSAHGLSNCRDSVNDGNVIATIENAYVQPTAAGSAGGNSCVNNGRVECLSTSGPAVAYGVSGSNSQNHGPVKAESTGNAAPAKEVYAVASGISQGSACYNDAIVSAHATLGAARAYGYDDRSSGSQSNANVQAMTDYYKSEIIDGKEHITRGMAYAMNSTAATAVYRGFTVIASNGKSSLIYLLHPQCSKHEGMNDVLLGSENIEEPMDNCYIFLGGAYSTAATEPAA